MSNSFPKAKKHFGQHFLVNEKVIGLITKFKNKDIDAIVEVGPGPGVLTKYLSGYNLPLYLIEKDRDFGLKLEKHTDKEKVFIEDALDFDWHKFLEDNNLKDKRIWLVSNLPYNVGSVLFVQFLQIEEIKYMTLMFQKEVGLKTYKSGPKNSSLRSLSLNFFDADKLCLVPPGSFSPPPKVDSIVVEYKRKDKPIVQIAEFKNYEKMLRLIFSTPRKKLNKKFNMFKTYPNELFERYNDLRPANLTDEDLYKLFELW